MGCQRQQLERHYDHSTSNSRRSNIVQVKRKPKAAAPVTANVDDPFLLEAMKRFQAGQIDKETLLALLKPNETES